jgi:hypothetical protein
MESLPWEFPSLPIDNAWSANLHHAHQILSNAYASSREILSLDDSDPLRLHVHRDRVYSELLPLLDVMENNGAESLPEVWLISAARCLAGIVGLINTTIDGMQDQ